MYLYGFSTRKTEKITEKLCVIEFSKGRVSRLAKQLDEKQEEWSSRSLDKAASYLVTDAT
ncbi:transposase [Candidatus Bipolaricaulota bacterium]|nr:transposase [Candidatus Bipolaricaulota bacterium]